MRMQLPLSVEIGTLIVFWIFLLLILRGVYKNYLVTIFTKRYKGPAHLDSKVAEEYIELKTYAGQGGRGIKSPGGGLRYSNKGIAYRLYFTVENKMVELDVDKGTFEQLPEQADGILDYKGNMYYSFVANKEKKDD